MFRHILLPIDGTSHSHRAIEAGIQLAKTLGVRITGLYVTDPTYVREHDEGLNVFSDKILADFSQQANSAGVVHDCVAIRGDTTADGIVGFAKENGCDVLVMGTHGRSRVGKFLLGSVAASVLADCDIPVLLYR